MATHEMAVQPVVRNDFEGAPQAEELVNRVLLFGRYLKALGFQVTPSRMLDVCRSLGYMDITRRDDFYDAARVKLVSHRDELPLFEAAFKNFWEPASPDPTDLCGLEEPALGVGVRGGDGRGGHDPHGGPLVAPGVEVPGVPDGHRGVRGVQGSGVDVGEPARGPHEHLPQGPLVRGRADGAHGVLAHAQAPMSSAEARSAAVLRA